MPHNIEQTSVIVSRKKTEPELLRLPNGDIMFSCRRWNTELFLQLAEVASENKRKGGWLKVDRKLVKTIESRYSEAGIGRTRRNISRLHRVAWEEYGIILIPEFSGQFGAVTAVKIIDPAEKRSPPEQAAVEEKLKRLKHSAEITNEHYVAMIKALSGAT